MGLGKVLVKHWKRWFGKNKDDIRVCDEDEETIQAKSDPEVTLATNRQSSAGSTPFMLSGSADLPCAGLSVDAMSEDIDDSVTLGNSHKLEEEQRNRENRLPGVILSIIAGNGGQDSSIPAPMQQSSASVPSGLADLPFPDLDIDAVLKELNNSAAPRISHNLEDERRNNANRHPEDTLSAFVETGRPESSIPVLKQRSYTGSKRVIPSALANLSCADLGVDAVFEKLSAILGQSPRLTASIRSVLESYITRDDDFGTVYAHLRCYWDASLSDIEHRLRRDEREAQEKEKNLLINGRIKTLHTGCRRVWDPYANRVVPWQATPDFPLRWGISHAWVDEGDLVYVLSPINRREWPVPIPRDANLDLIRIEMLNLEAHYVWLDVLCLRQEHELREDLRVQEWKIDMPTIGSVYASGKPVVCHFCGLGRPLHLKPGYFEDDRCWFKRAWTLQEISEKTIIAGETGDNETLAEDIQLRFHKQLASLRKMRRSHLVFDVLSEMKNWVATKPLDKIAGLGYILDLKYLPMYDSLQSEEDAYATLVDAMFRSSQATLLLLYPEPGNGSKSIEGVVGCNIV